MVLQGDIILAADGSTITTLRELETYCMFKEEVRLTVLRDGAEMETTVRTGLVDGSGTSMDMVVRVAAAVACWLSWWPNRCALFGSLPSLVSLLLCYPSTPQIWNGMCLHSTHTAVLQLGFTPEHNCDVFCSFTLKGSPGREIPATAKWLLRINGTDVSTLDDVLQVATRIGDRQYVRLTLQDVFSGTKQVYTLKTDKHFFPIQRFSHNRQFEWERSVLTAPYTCCAPQLKRQTSLLQFDGTGSPVAKLGSPTRSKLLSPVPLNLPKQGGRSTYSRLQVLGLAAVVVLVAVGLNGRRSSK